MARYDYKCTSCDKVFEVEHPMSDRPHITCPNCGADAERVFEPSGISFKGSGFYNTDQRGGSSSTAATSAPSESSTASAAPSNDACAGCEHCASK